MARSLPQGREPDKVQDERAFLLGSEPAPFGDGGRKRQRMKRLRSEFSASSPTWASTYAASISIYFARAIGRGEADFVEDPLQDGLQPTGADVLHVGVDLGRDARDRADRAVSELEIDPFGRQERRVLLYQAGLGLDQDPAEVLFGERGEFNANGQPPLEFGQQVRRAGDVECARSDKEDMVGPDGAVLGGTVVPSISGKRSRCTPSRDTSAPPRPSRAQILSISSRNTIPLLSTSPMASRTI